VVRFICLCLLLCSCSAAVRRGDQLFEQHDFLGATKAYEEALAADPQDTGTAARRDEARTGHLASLLAQVSTALKERRFTDSAAALGETFSFADAWGRPGTGQAELERLQTAWVEDFAARAERDGPLKLSPERTRLTETLKHPRFETLRAALDGAWSAVAAARCEQLSTVSSSFLGAFTLAYCHAAGRDDVKPSTPAVPVFSVSPKVESFLRGGSAMWPVTLTDAFDASPWASKESSDPASLSVSGQIDDFVNQLPVKRTAHWTVQVPFQSTRWVQVPYTTYQYYTYPCGRSTCSGSRPVTDYRNEPRSFTDYRSEPHTKDYDATEARAELSVQANMFVDLRPLAKPLGVVLKDDQVETGITHAAIPEAKLSAETAQVSSAAQWDERSRKAARDKLLNALFEHWHDAFCSPPLDDAEASARCAYGGRAQAGELAALQGLVRDDVSALVAQPRFGKN
jgi:hypothetical protein